MKRLTALGIIVIAALAPLADAAPKSPFSRGIDVEANLQTNSVLNPDEATRDALMGLFNSIGGEVQKLETAYGTIEDGAHIAGSIKALKLKPSDKKRLIALANGSLSERQKKEIAYDANLMELLVRLTSPKELGGGGIKHLRVGDLLRFRRDPRSRETENADNVSQHQLGKAADIVEINQTHCTEKSLLGGSEDLPPFPVKVAWQGGAPYNPTAAILSSFDATARAHAVADILGTLPTDGYEGGAQNLETLLQQLQRRVIADELGLDRSSLDFLIGNDFLLTLGQAVTNQALGLPTGSLAGETPEERIRSIARGYVEDSLRLPPGSLAGDTVQSALERLGRTKLALDAGVSSTDVIAGKVDGLKESALLKIYARAEAAFNLPSQTIESAKRGDSSAFAAIGAQLMATRLKYSPAERDDLVAKARRGQANQLSLARIGDLSRVPLNPLPVLAPSGDSSKKIGELALGKLIMSQKSNTTLGSIADGVSSALKLGIGDLSDATGRQQAVESLVNSPRAMSALRLAGAAALEDILSLPDDSLVEAVRSYQTPTSAQLAASIGRALIKSDPLARGSAQSLGEEFINQELSERFSELYHVSSVGIGRLSPDDMISILVGPPGKPHARAGASWVEENLGLAPDSFLVLYADASPHDRLAAAGVAVIAGEIFDAFSVSTHTQTSPTVVTLIGQAKIETVLGLVPGSFSGTIDQIRSRNSIRFSQIFSRSETVDALTGLPEGSAQKIVSGTLSPAAASGLLGQSLMGRLRTDTLENDFGWDSRYAINGNDLANALSGQGGDAKAILVKIGGYNTDFAMGWEPGTTEKIVTGSTDSANQTLLDQGSGRLATSIGLDLEHPKDLLRSYTEGLRAQAKEKSGEIIRTAPPIESVVVEAFKKRLDIPGLPADKQAPTYDVRSIVEGDLPNVHYAIIAANQAKEIKKQFDEAYQLYRTMIAGWASDPKFEISISREGFDRYQKVLADFAKTQLVELKDQALERITKGVVDKLGTLRLDISPFIPDDLKRIELQYFARKEARNEFFYGTLDAQIRAKDPTLPPDFTKTLFEGDNFDRATMLFEYVDDRVTDAMIQELPERLRPLAIAFIRDDNFDIGRQIAGDPQYQQWMSSVFATTAGLHLPKEGVALATKYASRFFTSGSSSPTKPGSTDSPDTDPNSIDSNTAASIAPDKMAVVVDTALGYVGGDFNLYYQKYRQINQLYNDYQSGNLDLGQAIFAVDAILLDGKLAGLTQSLDNALGLPGGSTQLLVQYALTQNPIYLAQFAFNLFFGVTIECPDLQEEAKRNVELLIKEIIRQGENSARLIPSQIITYHQSYLNNLRADIRKNYSVCLDTPGARCGVFARPEYSRQVHIGF